MSVRAYYHDDPEAPVLDGTAGSLIQLLQKCLVDGYGNVGQGTWKDPLGWEGFYDSVFQKAGFRSLDASGTQLWLYVDDTGPDATDGARTAYVRGWEEFSGFDGGDLPLGLVNPFPTLVQRPLAKWYKSSTADGTARSWVLIGDGSLFYLATAHYAPYPDHFGLQYFGDIASYRPGDAYHCALFCGTSVATNTPSMALHSYRLYSLQTTASEGFYLSRSHTQLVVPVNVAQVGLTGTLTGAFVGSTAFYVFPSPLDGGLHMSPVLVFEAGAGLRGLLPGIYAPHQARPLVHRGTVDGVTGLTGRTLQALALGCSGTAGDAGTGCALIDLTGPWR